MGFQGRAATESGTQRSWVDEEVVGAGGANQIAPDVNEGIMSQADNKERKYETVYILRADLTDEAGKKINDKVSEVVTRFQGKNLELKDLGKRPLAYRIAK